VCQSARAHINDNRTLQVEVSGNITLPTFENGLRMTHERTNS
jgi:hypothetical protein